MKLAAVGRRPALPALVLALTSFALSSLPPLRAQTAEDFGFGALKANSQPVTGTIPLLVIVYELSIAGSTRQVLVPNLTSTMDQLIFNYFSFPSVNGYFLENSHGSFSWERAGVLGPLTLNAGETATLYAQSSDDDGDGTSFTGLDCGAGFNYLLGLVAARTGYNFAQWDENADGSITQNELSVVAVSNNGRDAGANRVIGAGNSGFVVPGQNVTLRGRIASLDQRTSFLTIAHELSHSLGTSDLYGSGCFSSGLTLMTCTIFGTDDDRRTYHLDPWHKMRFGWLRPRIFPLGTGGVATIPAAQIVSANTHILLYDPAKGPGEYFIVEFRNNRISAGVDHDADLMDVPAAGPAAGMAVWHVNLSLPNNYAFHEGSPNSQMGGNTLWNQMTPVLRWSDGTATATRLNPIATPNGGRELVFEWITTSDTWVDFQYNGTETGTFTQPFNTLGEAANAASHGGTVKFKQGGTSAETLSISKRLELQATSGPVTIGR